MSFSRDFSDDAKPSDGLIKSEAEHFDNSSEVTVPTSVTSPSSVAADNNGQSNAAEDECDSLSAAPCVDENFNTVVGEVSELPVSIDKPAVDIQVIYPENSIESSDAVSSANIADSLAESCSDKKIVELPNDAELHSVVIITSDTCSEVGTESGLPTVAWLPDSDSADTWNGVSDVPSLLSLTLTLIPDDVLIKSKSGKECSSGQSDSDNCDADSDVVTDRVTVAVDIASCSADLTSTDVLEDECSSILLIDGNEPNDRTSKSAGTHISADVQKSVSSVRFMPPTDRRARPVPLPRSNTFRTKSASEALASTSNRSSIPVEYETCSSIQSKICQTMTLGEECESEYSLPAAVDFSEIYVDHKAVEEWHESSESAIYLSSYDSDYDVLREVVPTSEGYKILPHGDSRTASGDTTVLPIYESDYDLLKDDAWADVFDADNVPTYRQTEVPTGRPCPRTESGYDLLRDDIWNSSSDYNKTEIVPEFGLPTLVENRNSQTLGTWCNKSDVTKAHHMETPSPPVDVRVLIVLFLFIEYRH